MEKNDLREELIAKLEELLGEENAAMAYARAEALKKKWPRIREEEESMSDKELNDKFNAKLDELKEKAGGVFIDTETRKNEIINRAKEVLEKGNFKKGYEEMKQLLEEWKLAGRTSSKEKDDELWEQFKTVRDEFFEKKHAFNEQQSAARAENKRLKEELIEEMKKVADIEDIREAMNRGNELFDQWKQVKSAGRREDDSLWEQFQLARKPFFERRNEFRKNMKEIYAQRVEAKKALVEQAHLLLAKSTYSEEEVSEAKSLRGKWKEIGNAGKDNESTLWEDFDGTLNKYFDRKKEYDNNDY